MKKLFVLGMLVVLAALAGCGKQETAKDAGDSGAKMLPKEAVEKVLTLQQVPYTSVSIAGKEVIVSYEASNADKFDSQIVSDWATIFGTLADSNYEKITIKNTVSGVEYTSLSTTPRNVHELLTDKINQTVFWENVEIKAK